MASTLSPNEERGLANTCGAEAARLIANSVADAGTPGQVPSSGGLLQLGTNTTDALTLVGLVADQASNAVTAHAGGTQALAVALTGQVNRISVCATAADSVKLPPSRAGLDITVINDGAASAQVFGAGTDTINSVATATGVAQAAGTIVTYRCTAAGNWRSNAPTGVSGVGAAYKIARGVTALDGSNPTPVTTGLSTVVAAIVSLEGTAAPGLGTSTLTVDSTNYSTGALSVYAWKPTSISNPTLIASTGTENFEWIAIGT